MERKVTEFVLTDGQILSIEKRVFERFPLSKAEREGRACSAEKMQMARLRKRERDKLIAQEREKMEVRKRIYNDDLAA